MENTLIYKKITWNLLDIDWKLHENDSEIYMKIVMKITYTNSFEVKLQNDKINLRSEWGFWKPPS